MRLNKLNINPHNYIHVYLLNDDGLKYEETIQSNHESVPELLTAASNSYSLRDNNSVPEYFELHDKLFEVHSFNNGIIVAKYNSFPPKHEHQEIFLILETIFLHNVV